MKRLANFIIVFSAVSLVLKLAIQDQIDPERAATFLILVVAAAALGHTVIKLVLACAGLAFLLLDYTNYDMEQFRLLALMVGALLLLLFGFYVMFGGMRKRE